MSFKKPVAQVALDQRQRDAKAKSDWFAGKTQAHPHGLSGHRWIIPPEAGRNCWDTAPGMHRFSEYGDPWIE